MLLFNGDNRIVFAIIGIIALLKRDLTIKREIRLISYSPIKVIYEDDNKLDNNDSIARPGIDLIKELPISLFAKLLTKIPILKATNYYI